MNYEINASFGAESEGENNCYNYFSVHKTVQNARTEWPRHLEFILLLINFME